MATVDYFNHDVAPRPCRDRSSLLAMLANDETRPMRDEPDVAQRVDTVGFLNLSRSDDQSDISRPSAPCLGLDQDDLLF
jgi:hypothetical protein